MRFACKQQALSPAYDGLSIHLSKLSTLMTFLTSFVCCYSTQRCLLQDAMKAVVQVCGLQPQLQPLHKAATTAG
jgi:hypothetical protein